MPKGSIQRSTAELRRLGWRYEITERWNPYDHKRHDLFGFIDILAIAPDGLVGIQTGIGGHKGHKEKILANKNALAWLKSGGRLAIWTHRKLKLKRGSKVLKWKMRIEEITIDMFDMDGVYG
jgi:hypothetical protein